MRVGRKPSLGAAFCCLHPPWGWAASILVGELVLLGRWLYVAVGKFSGLIETMDQSIKFPIWTEKKGEMEEVVIAGPTCDSAATMYENYR